MPLDLTAVDLLTETVTTPRLLLRPWRHADAQDVFEACQDPASQRWVTALPSPYTREDAEYWVTELSWTERRAGTGLQSAMVEQSSDRVVGSVGLMRLGGLMGPEIGYWVAPWARGNGYAAEATDALARWALDRGSHRVWLLAATANLASSRTAERAGFRCEGVLVKAEVDRYGVPRDMAIFGRLATDPGPDDFGR